MTLSWDVKGRGCRSAEEDLKSRVGEDRAVLKNGVHGWCMAWCASAWVMSLVWVVSSCL